MPLQRRTTPLHSQSFRAGLGESAAVESTRENDSPCCRLLIRACELVPWD